MVESIYGLSNLGWNTSEKQNGCVCCPWTNIARHWKKVDHFSKFKLGSGARILFWHHKWIEDISLKDRFPNLFRVSSLPNGTIADFWDSSTSAWKIQTRRLFKDEEVSEFIDLLSVLNPFIPNNMADGRVWSLEPSGLFSVASLCKSSSSFIAT